MNHAELRKSIDEGVPFTLHVADGRSFDVPHRDFILLPPKSTIAVVAEQENDDPESTVTNIVPLLMISGVTQRVKG